MSAAKNRIECSCCLYKDQHLSTKVAIDDGGSCAMSCFGFDNDNLFFRLCQTQQR